ncbi:MAG: acyl-CoA dehydrogenase family protein [Alphaproteobacteria bacterium]
MSQPFVVDEMQEAVLDSVRRFVADEILPVAADLDANADPEESFSWDIVEKADAAGIRTMTLPEEWGGIGADYLTTGMVVEELAKGDIGISVVMAQTLKIAQIMMEALSEDQQQRFIPRFRDDPRGLLAIGITEPENGSNYFVHGDWSFNTRAEKVDGGWKINGMKHFVSNSNRANVFLLFVQTEKDKDLFSGSTCFILSNETPGFSLGQVHNKMGERLANNAEMIFQDCFVPDADVVGEVGNGFQILADFFPASNAYAGASVLGNAVATYEMTLEWAKNRVQGGKPLIQHDGIRTQLAEMHMMLDVARTYIRKATWAADNRDTVPWDPALGALPKIYASQIAWQIATWAMEIHGGSGFMKEIGLEKRVRDAAAFLHSDGVNRTLFLKAADYLYKD